jgi:Holliday junction DNA helicase RuvA
VIARLRGTIVECKPTHVVLDVAGVGYRVGVSVPTYVAMMGAATSEVTLLVHTHVREDALQLFGFATEEERAVFEDLLTVSGVGPRLGLGILSGIGAVELRDCVARADVGRLQKVPGVGKKTAERLLLELQHRWDTPRGRLTGAEAAPSRSSMRDDAVSALVNLGYASEAARRTVDASLADRSEPVELGALLRDSLVRLSR